MSTPLQKFNKKVKAYRRAHPGASFKSAQQAVKRGRSAGPAKKKKKAVPRKKAAVRKKASGKKRPAKVSGLTRTGSSMGSVSSHLATAKRMLTAQLGNQAARLFNAKTKKAKNVIRKSIKATQIKLRRLQ